MGACRFKATGSVSPKLTSKKDTLILLEIALFYGFY